MGGVSVGNATGPGVNNRLAAAQAAEAQTSEAESKGTIASAEAGRQEFNTAVGEEKQLPGVFGTANQGAEAAGTEQTRAETSQQNIDTQKRAASFTGVLSKGLSSAGSAILGGSSPASAPNIPDTGDITGNPMSGGSLPAGSGAAPTPPNIPNIVPGQP